MQPNRCCDAAEISTLGAAAPPAIVLPVRLSGTAARGEGCAKVRFKWDDAGS